MHSINHTSSTTEGVAERVSRLEARLSGVRDELGELCAELALLGANGSNGASTANRSQHCSPAPPAPAEPAAPLTIRLLGEFTVAVDGHIVFGSGSDRASAVVRFLAAAATPGVHKERLATQFWGDADDRVARRNVHQAIYTIRKALGGVGAERLLRLDGDHYSLGNSGERWRDIDVVDAHMVVGRSALAVEDSVAARRAFEQVDLLYQGELLATYPYDDWAQGPREHYRGLHREACDALFDLYRADGASSSIVHLARRLLDLDPCDELACRTLIDAYIELGQVNMARMAFVTLAAHMETIYDVSPAYDLCHMVRALNIYEQDR